MIFIMSSACSSWAGGQVTRMVAPSTTGSLGNIGQRGGSFSPHGQTAVCVIDLGKVTHAVFKNIVQSGTVFGEEPQSGKRRHEGGYV